MTGNIWLGTQGFSFKDWVGPFYPPGTASKAFLETYARHFPAVEIDSTFYGTPRPSTILGWYDRTPASFRFAAKFPRQITHDKKLVDALPDANAFIETMQALGEKLGVLILQFAYDFQPEHLHRLDTFLSQIPAGIRYAVEVRNREWMNEDFRSMLEEHGVALVLQDLHYMPRVDWITADFTVIRWLGRRKDIDVFDRIRIDRTESMQAWAGLVHSFLERDVDVFGFFNNHYAGHSPESVRLFASMLDMPLEPTPSEDDDPQMTFEL